MGFGRAGQAQAGAAAWYALDAATVEQRLSTDAHGLSRLEVEARLDRYGPNEIEEEPPPSAWAVFAGQFELDVFYARARGYDTALEAYLDKDNIPVAVHDNLIAAVNANLEPLHRYVELRKRTLGLEDIFCALADQAGEWEPAT